MQAVLVQVRKLEITLLLEGFEVHIGHVGLMEKQGHHCIPCCYCDTVTMENNKSLE